MGAFQRSYVDRALLPFEVELCQTLGLSKEDYFYFCQLAEAGVQERPAEYALIPDVRNIPVSVIISLVIGIAFSAIGALLAPKPKAPEERRDPRQLKTADITGQSRFAQYFAFDSLQDLAALGEILPLVFANRQTEKNIGGIRTKALMIWSQMLSLGSQQELKMLCTLGLGLLPSPDLEGYALGDQLLKTNAVNRFSLYYRDNGGRVDEIQNRYTGPTLQGQGFNDVFLAPDDWVLERLSPMFSGTRTPNSQTTFGVYAPVCNGSQFWLPYDLVLAKNADSRMKKEKILTPYSTFQGMVIHNGQTVATDNAADAHVREINVGDTVDFLISGDQQDEEGAPPHGLSDVNNAVADRHYFADDSFKIGESFLFGSALVECIGTSTNEAWIPGAGKSFQFRCVERGYGSFVGRPLAPTGNLPWGFHIQKVEYGVVTNNRACDQTEIGIKSVVWKRLNNWANVNSEPDPETIREYELSDQDTIQLGRVTRYVTRWSFFRLYYRNVQSPFGTPWSEITNGTIFAVRSNSPQAIYSFIRVSHPRGQYEFRLAPVCGAEARTYEGRYVIVLDGIDRNLPPLETRDGIYLTFSGRGEYLTQDGASNKDFRKYGRNAKYGTVINIYPTNVGTLPPGLEWDLVSSEIDFLEPTREFRYAYVVDTRDASVRKAFWNSEEVVIGSEYRQGAFYKRIPAIVTAADWVTTNAERLMPTGGNYYEVDAAGNFINAFWDGVLVNAGTEQNPSNPDPTALYRRGTQYTTAKDDSKFVFESTVYVPVEQSQGAFGVWRVVGQPESTQRAFWNGVEVPLNVTTYVAPGVLGRYIRGAFGGYFANINCNVYYITRETLQPGTTTRYFYGIVRGYYEAKQPALDVYYIDKYEFDAEKHPFVHPPADYTVTGGSGSGMVINASSFAKGQWQWQLQEGGNSYQQGETVQASFPDGTTVGITVAVHTSQPEEVLAVDLNPWDALTDYKKYDEEQTSHEDGPEHSVTYVNEMLRQQTAPQYEEMALVGLRMRAGDSWTSLGQLTAYCKQGIHIERLITDDGTPTTTLSGPTNLLPEIAYNLLVDSRIGAGKRVPRSSVDRDAMTEAAQFCRANGFYWDGVISERTGLRNWIFEQAAYCLMNFTIVGGRFALQPAVTYNPSTGVIDASIPVPISALLTDGNMRNMKITWLSADERRLFKAVVSYRDEVENGFSINRTVRMRLADSQGGSDGDPEEAFDLTGFCTSRKHAETFAKYALLVRKEVDHAISFETTPGAVAAMAPGSFIKVVSEATHTSRFNNGSIDSEGNITGTTAAQDGTFEVVYWHPGDTQVQSGSVRVVDGRTADSRFFNCVYTVAVNTSQKRVYQIESVSINDDGLVDVTATHQPLNSVGGLAVIDFSYDKFKVDE